MRPKLHQPLQEAWGGFRLSVIGQLLASPPPKGDLQAELEKLAQKEWKHPISGKPFHIAAPTIEQWYYQAKGSHQNPIQALRWKTRRDCGQFRKLSEAVRGAIHELHKAHPGWTHQLHFDNLLVLATKRGLGEIPSYPTVRRYRKAQGFIRVRVPRNADRAAVQVALERRESREQRSFESSHVLGLVHSDFHHCSRKLLNEQGEWVKPVLVAFLDDRSRLVCHAQWYWRETAENFVHALSQAILKRGLPRALMTDNGSPMTATETTEGLERLSILHQTTLPYSPNQNGKQECFWGQVEGRLMAMLEGEETLTLKLLNDATIAWVEMEYHRKTHSETGQTPLKRFLEGPSVGRDAPPLEALRRAFTLQDDRSLRRGDGTISVESRRYEVPSAFQHMPRIVIRYARWDLANVFLVNPQSSEIIGQIFPRDLEKNADGIRRSIEPRNDQAPPPEKTGMAPLLKDQMEAYSATGLPMGYLPKEEETE